MEFFRFILSYLLLLITDTGKMGSFLLPQMLLLTCTVHTFWLYP